VAGFLVWVCLLVPVTCWPQGLTVSEEAAGSDDLPPAPASHLQALDRPADQGGHIVLSWVLSPDDRIHFGTMVPGPYEPTSGQPVVFGRRGIEGYRVYRSAEAGAPQLLGVVAAGVDTYLDAGARDGVPYRYEVRAYDASHETAMALAPGSAEDAARTARARDDRNQPRDAAGRPVLGWYDRSNATVGLDDFFLFADHFGRVEGEIGFDPQYDLDGDRRVGFADFFVFADHFGAVVANFAEMAGN
jgi:hypothetical protein